MSDDDERAVPSLRLVSSTGDHEPRLTDAELVRIRHMLRDFDKIGNVCPIARRVMYGRDDQGSAS